MVGYGVKDNFIKKRKRGKSKEEEKGRKGRRKKKKWLKLQLLYFSEDQGGRINIFGFYIFFVCNVFYIVFFLCYVVVGRVYRYSLILEKKKFFFKISII